MIVQPRTKLISNVARKGFEEITILVHGASNVPQIDKRNARVYLTGQSKYTLTTQQIGDKPNATNVLDGPFPMWNDLVFVETQDENVDEEELILLLIDEPRRRNIKEYRVPWKWLQPFYQYHLELSSDSKDEFPNLKLYVSLTRKQNILSKQDFKYFGLEAALNHFEISLTQKQSIYAAARIIPDYKSYKYNYLVQNSSSIDFIRVIFPNPSYGSFVPKSFDQEGFPQISLASTESKRVVWLHNFLFSLIEEKDAMFTNESALVIEFYPYRKISSKTWRIRDPLGWVAIKLDERIRETIEKNTAQAGLKTLNMIVEGDGSLESDNGQVLTAEVFMRLIQNRHPKNNLNMMKPNLMPILNSHYTEENERLGIEPVYLQTKGPKKNYEQPKLMIRRVEDAKINELPRTPIQENSGQLVHKQPQPIQQYTWNNYNEPQIDLKLHNLMMKKDFFNDLPAELRLQFSSIGQPSFGDVQEWLLYCIKVIECYNSICKRMIVEVTTLKQQMTNLELSNTQLRSKLGNFEEKKLVLLKLAQMNETDKSKLNDYFLDLRSRLAIKTDELVEMRQKVGILEQELKTKSEYQNSYKSLVDAHNKQNKEIHLLQIRLKEALSSEETCKRQEIVIEKMEALIRRIVREKILVANTPRPNFEDPIDSEIQKIKNIDY